MAIETLYRVAGEDELYTSMEAAKKAEFENEIKKVLWQCSFVYLTAHQADKLATEVATWLNADYILTLKPQLTELVKAENKQEDVEAHYD